MVVRPRDPPFTLEEHFTPPELASQDAASPLYVQQKLADLDGLRLQKINKRRNAKQWVYMIHFEKSAVCMLQIRSSIDLRFN